MQAARCQCLDYEHMGLSSCQEHIIIKAWIADHALQPLWCIPDMCSVAMRAQHAFYAATTLAEGEQRISAETQAEPCKNQPWYFCEFSHSALQARMFSLVHPMQCGLEAGGLS